MSYLCDLFFIFFLIFIMITLESHENRHTCFFAFQNMSYYFLMLTWMKNVNNLQTVKFSLRVLLSICLIFCQFQPWVAYKSAAYKKSVYNYSYTLLHISLRHEFWTFHENFNPLYLSHAITFESDMVVLTGYRNTETRIINKVRAKVYIFMFVPSK